MTKTIRVVVLIALCLVLATPVAASASTASGRYESQVIKHTNAARAHHDLKLLKKRACIDRYAERQARRMRSSQKMVHQSLGPIMKRCGLKSVGENIAYGYPSGKKVTAAWMKSKPHRANILKKGYRLIGVGAVQDKDGIWWVSQVFGTAK